MKTFVPKKDDKLQMTTLSIRLKEETKERIFSLAKDYGMAPTGLMRQMIEHCVSELEQEKDEKLKKTFIYQI